MARTTDDVEDAAWALHPRARAAVMMQASREALAGGDAVSAAAIAEELLDGDPDDLEALMMVAEAAPRFGHGEVGMLAAAHVRRRGGDPGTVEAAAALASCCPELALKLADGRLRREDSDARAHAVRAQALELLGRIDEADLAHERAHLLHPVAYPRGMQLTESDWCDALTEGMDCLPPPQRHRFETGRLSFIDVAPLDALRAWDPPRSPSTRVLWLEPTRCVLIRRALARGAMSRADIFRNLAEALAEDAASEGPTPASP